MGAPSRCLLLGWGFSSVSQRTSITKSSHPTTQHERGRPRLRPNGSPACPLLHTPNEGGRAYCCGGGVSWRLAATRFLRISEWLTWGARKCFWARAAAFSVNSRIRSQRQHAGHGHRHHHRSSLWARHQLVCLRYHDAAHWADLRPSFRHEQQVHQSLRPCVCDAGGGESSRSRDHKLWPLPQRSFRFPVRRFRRLSSRPAGKPSARSVCSERPGDQGVPILRLVRAGESNTVPELHFAAKCGVRIRLTRQGKSQLALIIFYGKSCRYCQNDRILS